MDAVDPRLRGVLRDLVVGRLPWPLYLFGQPGRGKTCAALALADMAATACYWTADSLADAVMQRNVEPWPTIAAKDLAILDEIGCREKIGDLHFGAVKQFADVREQQAQRVALYVSNVPPAALGQLYDGRIASRLLCGTVFELKGADRRFST